MPSPWCSDDEIKIALANCLKKDVGDLDPYWDQIVTDSNADAANDLSAMLLGRGYTSAQLDAWDARKTYNRDIALYLALVKGAALAEYDQTSIDKLDRRKQLEASTGILIGGEIVLPGNGDTGPGAAGGVIDDSCYRINMRTRF